MGNGDPTRLGKKPSSAVPPFPAYISSPLLFFTSEWGLMSILVTSQNLQLRHIYSTDELGLAFDDQEFHPDHPQNSRPPYLLLR